VLRTLHIFVQSRWRQSWRALLLLAVFVALVTGLVMTAAIGVRRSGSAWNRFAAATRSPDAFNEVPIDQARGALDQLEARPGVEHAALMTYILVSPQGKVPAGVSSLGGFVGLSPDFGTSVYRPLILRGRAADPTRADEFTINEAMSRLTGLQPGDAVTLVSSPAAVQQSATVVGIQAGPLDVTLNTDSPGALFTPAFGARWLETYLRTLPTEDRANYSAVMLARVSSASTRSALLASGYMPGDAFGSEAIGGLRAQRNGFLVLAVVGGTGAVLAIGQALSRRTRRHADQLPTLGALGLAPRHRRELIAAAPCSAALIGLVLAPLVAYMTSPWVAIGVSKRLEVGRPHVVDSTVMLTGVLVGAVLFAAVALLAAARADTTHGARVARPGRAHLPGAAGLLGARVAGGWGTANGRTLVRSHIFGGIVAVTAITGVAVWSGAADHLVSTPARYGVTWDASLRLTDENSPSSPLDRADDLLSTHPEVASRVARVVAGMATQLHDQLEVVVIDRSRDRWWPTVIAGRQPVTDNEITVGREIQDARIGSTKTLGGVTFTIVGKHVLAPLKNGAPGGSVAMSAAAASSVELNPADDVILVRLAHGATTDDLRDLVGNDVSVSAAAQSRSGDISNLARTRGLLEVLLLACAFLGVATFVNGLLVASRSRRHDYATMRSLGARERTITAAIGWHALIVAAFAAAVGIPVGLVVGRTVWRRTADGLNAIPDLWRWPIDAGAIAVGALLTTIAAVAVAAFSVTRDPALSRPE
jgi:hypothetical protein